jgi:hypothetical protein
MSRRSSAASIRTAQPFLPVTSSRSIRANWVVIKCSWRRNARTKLEFTLIGDTVNVAERVEQLTKITGDPILLTQQSVDALVPRPPGLTDRGIARAEGKSAAVQVFGLDLGIPSASWYHVRAPP